MGAQVSQVDLQADEIDELALEFSMTHKEVRRLYKRFRKLDREHRGAISKDELMAIPELAMNPLVSRILTVFETDTLDQITFKSFLRGMSVFHTSSSAHRKIYYVFRMYDVNKDQFVCGEDLEEVIGLMVGANLSKEQVRAIVGDTIRKGDKDKDGKLSFEEFTALMVQSPNLHAKLTIPFEYAK